MSAHNDLEKIEYTPIKELTGPGEARSNIAMLAELFPDAVVDGRVNFDALRDLLGEQAEASGTETSGLRWVGMAQARRLSTVPATSTLLPRPDESVEWDSTRNIVIEGDNLEVLRLLRRGYTSKVDVIYIDPPYNTGNDFVYDDKRGSTIADHEAEAGLRDVEGATQTGEGSDRAEERRQSANLHAKWLSMMYPRLLIAHSLLKETGVFIAAIDDTEHARLKLLLDRVFGAENFAANVVWHGRGKNDARFTAGGLDYMLIYAKNKSRLVELNARWKEPKRGYGLVVETAKTAWRESGGDHVAATDLLRQWWRTKPDTEKGLQSYSEIDENGHAYLRGPLASPNPRENLKYDIPHPVTGQPVPMHANGWRYSRAVMESLIDSGRIIFGDDHSTTPRRKIYLHEQESQSIRSVVTHDRSNGTEMLVELLGSDVFDNPKDVSILGRWINAVTEANPDALVLDFFAGSGSTGHAVMDLNASDGGSRSYIQVQIDEPASIIHLVGSPA